MNPLMIWLDKSKDPYRIGKDNYWAQAYADDTANIIEAIRKSRQIPKAWKESLTVLIYKGKGNKSDPLAYRPIALLSCIYKVYSHIINQRLTKWVADNHISSTNQHRFRKGTDTADASAELLTCIEHASKTGNPIHLALLDVAKAYDSVEVYSMEEILSAYGLHANDVEIIMNMIKGNKTHLDTAHGTTEEIHIEAGVRQGDIISPTLYMLFLNPLIKWIEARDDGYRIGNNSTAVKAYADDMALVSNSKEGMVRIMKKVNRFMEHN